MGCGWAKGTTTWGLSTQSQRRTPGCARQRVLIVDDQRTFAELLEVAISSYEEFECLGVASSPDEGLAVVARERPDLVIMDVHFAGQPVDGVTAAAEVRRFESCDAGGAVDRACGPFGAAAGRGGRGVFVDGEEWFVAGSPAGVAHGR